MNEDMPYNNDNFYPLNGEQKLPFNFMNTHPTKNGYSADQVISLVISYRDLRVLAFGFPKMGVAIKRQLRETKQSPI